MFYRPYQKRPNCKGKRKEILCNYSIQKLRKLLLKMILFRTQKHSIWVRKSAKSHVIDNSHKNQTNHTNKYQHCVILFDSCLKTFPQLNLLIKIYRFFINYLPSHKVSHFSPTTLSIIFPKPHPTTHFPCQVEKLLSFLSINNSNQIEKRRMGCEQSRLVNSTPLPLSIADPAFLKPGHSAASLLQRHNVAPRAYINVPCLLAALADSYTNVVVVRVEDLQELQEGLENAQLDPRIFVLGNGNKNDGEAQTSSGRLNYFNRYEDLPSLLQKLQKPTIQPQMIIEERVDVRILKDFRSEADSQLFIFQETLKAKGITYHLYSTFNQLQVSHVKSPLLVVDYRFHRAAINLKQQSKVICYCGLSVEEEYDPSVFFVTDNFQEVISQVLIFKRNTQPILPLSKVFLYSTNNTLIKTAPIFQQFDLKVRAYTSLPDLIKATRLYFSVLLICPEEQGEEVQRRVKEQGCTFRIRVLRIPQGTDFSTIGLRKIIREAKRGYLVERGLPKVVDIIDKFHNTAKFQQIKKELTANGIEYKSYSSVPTYCKSLSYIAPLIICSFDDRLLLHRFLGEAQSRAKVIIFCNKNKITQQLTRDIRWSFVSSHFGRIIRYIRTLHVLLPATPHPRPPQENKQKQHHRISALKWAQQTATNNSDTNTNNNVVTPSDSQRQFIQVTDLQTLPNIAQECCSKLKLPYRPSNSLSTFRKDLIASLGVLRNQYRLDIQETDFGSMMSSLSQATLQELSLRARRFLGEEKDMGIGINTTLKGLTTLAAEEYQAAKEPIFLLLLNFLGCYQLPLSQSCTLSCWTHEDSLEQYNPGAVLLSKNFLVLRQEGAVETVPGCVKLQLDLEYSPITSDHPHLSPFFCFDGRYVLPPHSQLRVTRVQATVEQRTIYFTLQQKNNFLQQYFKDNFVDDFTQLSTELMKPSSSLIDPQHQKQIQSNLIRLQAFSLLNNSQNLSQAASLIEGLIHNEEQSQAFDGRLLTELKLQLATILSKQPGKEQAVVELISDIKDESPSAYIRKICAGLLENVGEKLARRQEKAKTQKCIDLKAQIEQSEDDEEEEEEEERLLAIGGPNENNIFQCLQLDENEALTQQFA